jgi:hypothetical protein
MNTPSRTRVNGDASAGLAVSGGSATSEASQPTHALLQAPGGATAEVKNVKAEPAAAPVRPEKAMGEPDENPAIPRDKYHNRGGLYGLVDGKRVPIDEDGKPLPLDADGFPLKPDADSK